MSGPGKPKDGDGSDTTPGTNTSPFDSRTDANALPSVIELESPTGEVAESVTKFQAEPVLLAELVATLGAGETQQYKLYARADDLVIGRGSASDWFIDDASLSRSHARFHWDGSKLTVEDLGSQNGTRLRGEKLTSETVIAPGTSLLMGKVTVQFRKLGEDVTNRHDENATEMVELPEHRAEVKTKIRDAAAKSLASEKTGAPDPTRINHRDRTHEFGAPKSGSVLFRSDEHGWAPHEITRQWDLNEVQIVVKRKDLEQRELAQSVADMLRRFRSERRLVFLVGAVIWVIGLIGLLKWHEMHSLDEGIPTEEPAIAVAAMLPDMQEPNDGGAEEIADALSDAARATLQSEAIGFYAEGRMAEAKAAFAKLGSKDPVAVFMVRQIELKTRPGTK